MAETFDGVDTMSIFSALPKTDTRESYSPALLARLALRDLTHDRREREIGGPEPFLAKRARKVVSVAHIPAYQLGTDFDTWRSQVFRPSTGQLIQRLLDAGDVRQLAPLAMPWSSESDQAPHPLIPPKPYASVERIMNEQLGVSLTLTVEPESETFTLWVGYV